MEFHREIWAVAAEQEAAAILKIQILEIVLALVLVDHQPRVKVILAVAHRLIPGHHLFSLMSLLEEQEEVAAEQEAATPHFQMYSLLLVTVVRVVMDESSILWRLERSMVVEEAAEEETPTLPTFLVDLAEGVLQIKREQTGWEEAAAVQI